MATVHLLHNPVSGQAHRGDLPTIVRLVETAGHEVVDVTADSAAASLGAARDAVAAGAGRLVVVGGDGLVHQALQAVAGTDCVLGLVPQGTGNDFARELGLLDRDLEATVHAALADPARVDALRTTHGWVATVATLGFAGDVTARANAMRWPRGEAVYSIATVLQLPRLRRIPLVVTVDGVEHDLETTLLSVGNTACFGGGMRICPGARADDGTFELVSVGGVGRLTFLRVFPKVFKGEHVDHPAVTVLRGRSVRLSTDGPVDLWGDGERLGPLPVDLEVVPGAVGVAGAAC